MILAATTVSSVALASQSAILGYLQSALVCIPDCLRKFRNRVDCSPCGPFATRMIGNPADNESYKYENDTFRVITAGLEFGNALASGGQLLLQLLDAGQGAAMLGGRDGAGARLALLHPCRRCPFAPDDDRVVE